METYSYAISLGHQKTGKDIASVGLLNEYDVIRAYGYHVIEGLKKLGNRVFDVTPPENNRTLNDSLNYRIDKANKLEVDYYISLHANKVSVVARGCEAVYGSDNGKVLATNIVNELMKLGFPKHQGAYRDQRGLAEIKRTLPIATIVEPFFVHDARDVELYKKIGPKKLGYAIVKGITGKDVPEEIPENKPIKEVKQMDTIIIHDGGADKRAAEYLADYLQCPTISKANSAGVIPFYKKVIVVGGNWEPTEDSILITGTDRYDTLKAVLKYMKKL